MTLASMHVPDAVVPKYRRWKKIWEWSLSGLNPFCLARTVSIAIAGSSDSSLRWRNACSILAGTPDEKVRRDELSDSSRSSETFPPKMSAARWISSALSMSGHSGPDWPDGLPECLRVVMR